MSHETDEPVESGASPSRTLLVMAGFAIGLAFFAAALIVYFRDPIQPVTAAEVAAAKTLWSEEKEGSYDLDIEITGLRAGQVHVEVRNGEVTAMTRDGKTPDQERTWQVWTVEGQFEMIEREFELAADPQGQMNLAPGARVLLHGEFDKHYGYPRRFRRLIQGGPGTEMSWRVTRFMPVIMPIRPSPKYLEQRPATQPPYQSEPAPNP